MYSLSLLGITAFVTALLLTPLVRNLVLRWGFVDLPGERKIHTRPVPRVGGFPVAFAYMTGFGVLLLAGSRGGDVVWSAHAEIWRLFPAAVVIFCVGLYDDLVGLRPWFKIAGQLVAAGMVYADGFRVQGVGGHEVGHWWSLPVTLLWLLLCTNAMNLIDGVDGLAAGVGLFATMTTLTAALLQNNFALALATAPLAGALLGFLRFNFNPATIFLGDSGSLFIGFLLGCYGIIWSQKSATLLGMTAPLMALAIPLLDTALAVCRRLLGGKPIFTADNGHIHHRLLAQGFTHRKVVLLLYGCCALGSMFSLAMMNQNYSGVVIIAFCVTVWIGVQQLGYVEFALAGRMAIEGAFRRHLNAQIALQAIEKRFSEVVDAEGCWFVLQQAASEFGFYRVRMRLAGRTFEHVHGVPPLNRWSIRISLDDYDFVELDRNFDVADNGTALAALAELLQRTLLAILSRKPQIPEIARSTSAT